MTPAPAPLDPENRRQHFRSWAALVLLLIPALLALIWAGSSWNPRSAIPWTFTKTGWLVPAPGLGNLWLTCAALFWLLSQIAYRLFNPLPNATQLKPWASAALILLLALAARLLIAKSWTPLLLNPAALPASIAHRFLLSAADILVIAILMLALAGAGKSLWWAALYALHPLPLLEIAGNGHTIIFVILPLVFLAAIAHRFPRALRTALAATLLALGLAWIIHLTHQNANFNSLAQDLVQSFTLPTQILLPLLAALLGLLILFLSHRQHWPLPKTFAHLLIALLLCSPAVYPQHILPLLALLPLAWPRAAWPLTLTALAAYAALPATPLHTLPQVPEWLLLLEWTPTLILELHELAAELRRTHRNPTAYQGVGSSS